MKLILSLAIVFSSIPVLAQAAQKEWTFLVYLSGNNDLDDFGHLDMNEMETVGSTGQINVVVQWASLKNKTVKRILVQKDSDTKVVSSPVVEEMGTVDMGDHRSLVDFINWGVKNYPAKHYFINVWNHGSGWRLKPGSSRMDPLDISFDENSKNSITTKQLGEAINETSKSLGRKFDLYGSDACLMAMIEVAAEMRNSVENFLGSQELEPGDGWPYHLFLSAWAKNPFVSAEEVSKILIQTYFESYAGSFNKDRITLSSLNLKNLNGLLGLVETVAGQLQSASTDDKAKIKALIAKTQKFYYADYRDLNHFLTLLEQAQLASLKPEDLSALKAAIGAAITSNQASSPKFQNASGLSVWLPDAVTFPKYETRYQDMFFDKVTGWGAALKSVLGL